MRGLLRNAKSMVGIRLKVANAPARPLSSAIVDSRFDEL